MKLLYFITGFCIGAAAGMGVALWMLVNQPPFPFELLGKFIA